MAKGITNTSDLRKMLLETIAGVKSGKIEPRQASAIAALSSKILQSAKLDLEALRYNSSENAVEKAGQRVLQLVSA